MTNHIHLISNAAENYNLLNILRDFKKYTSKYLTHLITNNFQESRKSWLLWLIKSNGIKNNNNKDIQFWQQKNHPVELSNAEMVRQRLDYLHNNPVKEGIVSEPHHYLYSSAIDYAGGKGLLDIEFII